MSDFIPFHILGDLACIALGYGIRYWITSPQRKIDAKYRAERRSAMRD